VLPKNARPGQYLPASFVYLYEVTLYQETDMNFARHFSKNFGDAPHAEGRHGPFADMRFGAASDRQHGPFADMRGEGGEHDESRRGLHQWWHELGRLARFVRETGENRRAWDDPRLAAARCFARCFEYEHDGCAYSRHDFGDRRMRSDAGTREEARESPDVCRQCPHGKMRPCPPDRRCRASRSRG
jgi:hypothetical protein